MSSCYCRPRTTRSRGADGHDPAADASAADQADSRPDTGRELSDTVTYDTIGSRSDWQRKAPTDVPPLAISLDPDQMNYLRQQSDRLTAKTTADPSAAGGQENGSDMDLNKAPSTIARMTRSGLMEAKQQLYVMQLLQLFYDNQEHHHHHH